jgi:hypothetical protein
MVDFSYYYILDMSGTSRFRSRSRDHFYYILFPVQFEVKLLWKQVTNDIHNNAPGFVLANVKTPSLITKLFNKLDISTGRSSCQNSSSFYELSSDCYLFFEVDRFHFITSPSGKERSD